MVVSANIVIGDPTREARIAVLMQDEDGAADTVGRWKKMGIQELREAMTADWYPWRMRNGRKEGDRICKRRNSDFKSYQLRALNFAAIGVILFEGEECCRRCQSGLGPIEGCYFGKVQVRGRKGFYRWGAACANCAYANRPCEAP